MKKTPQTTNLRDVIIWAMESVKPCPDATKNADFCPSCLYVEIMNVLEDIHNGK